jgi:hypothetical protein
LAQLTQRAGERLRRESDVDISVVRLLARDLELCLWLRELIARADGTDGPIPDSSEPIPSTLAQCDAQIEGFLRNRDTRGWLRSAIEQASIGTGIA